MWVNAFVTAKYCKWDLWSIVRIAMSERPIAGSRVMEHHRRREERIEKGGDFYIQRQHRWHAMSKGENRERKEQ